MKKFAQKEFPFPDPRSVQDLATAIWNYELLPARDFSNVKGEHIHSQAKTFAFISLDEGSRPVQEFRHALFVLSQGTQETLIRRTIENALYTLEELADIYDRHAAESRKSAAIEFIDTHEGPAARHNAEIAADINDAENYTVIAGKLRSDNELHHLVHALANKLQVQLKPRERER
ncbi:MAG: hypothetical protein ACK502_01770 [Alphaproteobacteria bacterium]